MGSLMTFKEAAAVILREAQKPLHYDVITTRALQGNLIESQGLTPASTMGSILSQDIKENGSRSEFVHRGNGMYGLNPGYATTGKQRRKVKGKRRGSRTRGGNAAPVTGNCGKRLRDYIESNIDLDTNHELVILKHLLKHRLAHHGQLAEELARYNGLNDSDLDDVKKLIGVPQLQKLERLNFITNRKTNGRNESEWGCALSIHDAARIMEALLDKLADYQRKHDLPLAPKRGRGIDWRIHADMLSSPGDVQPQRPTGPKPGGTAGPGPDGTNSWIWSVNADNFKIMRSHQVWASQAEIEKIQDRVKPGDLVAVYLIGHGGFVAVYEFVGDWYRSPAPMWSDESGGIIHKSQIRVKQVKEGFVPMSDLEGRLSIFQDASDNRHLLKLRSGGGYPGNNGKPIPSPDMQIIIGSLGRGNFPLEI